MKAEAMPVLSVLHSSIDEVFVGHCWVQRPGNTELAGHKELTVTQRYMHLSPAALDTAIRLLDFPQVRLDRGWGNGE
jgi:hypothetical protein